jgi:hypothetical protein
MSPDEVCDWGKQSTQTKKTNAAKQTFRKFTGYPLLKYGKTRRHKDTEAQRRASKTFFCAPLCLCVFVSLCF